MWTESRHVQQLGRRRSQRFTAPYQPAFYRKIGLALAGNHLNWRYESPAAPAWNIKVGLGHLRFEQLRATFAKGHGAAI